MGAFLSLFNKIALLRRYLPAKRFGKCEFGLTARDQLDCIYCDRCRYQAKASTGVVHLPDADDARRRGLSYCFVIGVVAVALIVSSFSVDRLYEVVWLGEEYPGVFLASGGQPRDVDLQKIQALIRQGKLSDHEAEFYKKLD